MRHGRAIRWTCIAWASEVLVRMDEQVQESTVNTTHNMRNLNLKNSHYPDLPSHDYGLKSHFFCKRISTYITAAE